MASVDLLFEGAYTPPAGGSVDLLFGGTGGAGPNSVTGLFAAISRPRLSGHGQRGHDSGFRAQTQGWTLTAETRAGHIGRLAAYTRTRIDATVRHGRGGRLQARTGPTLLRGYSELIAREPHWMAVDLTAPYRDGRTITVELRLSTAATITAALGLLPRSSLAALAGADLRIRSRMPEYQDLGLTLRDRPTPALIAETLWTAWAGVERQGQVLRLGTRPGTLGGRGLNILDPGARLAAQNLRMLDPAAILRPIRLHAIHSSTVPIVAGRRIRWIDGWLLRPGHQTRAPVTVPPEPWRYEPPTGTVDLIFCNPLAPGRLELLFRRYPCPDIGLRAIPRRRVYFVQDTASIIRLADGRPLRATSLSITTDVDSWVWSGRATLAAQAELAWVDPSAAEPSEVRMRFNGHDFDLIVENDPEQTEDLTAAATPNDSATLRGRSLGAYLDSPYARDGTWSNDEAFTAQQLAANVLPLEATLSWDLEDWTVTAGAWNFAGTQARALIRIAEAGGGFLASTATGLGFRMAPYYSVPPWQWYEVAPWATLPKSALIPPLKIQWYREPDYNRVFIIGNPGGGLIGQVTRAGTAGDRLAPQIADALATDPIMIRQRAAKALGESGRHARVTLSLPVGPELGIVPLGALLAIQGTGGFRGMVRAVEISASLSNGLADIVQTLTLERREPP